MAKPSASDIAAYRKKLMEYAVIYNRMSQGMQNGYAAYNRLVQQVAEAAAYLRMIEDMTPSLIDHKPKNYTSHYRKILYKD